MVNMTDSEEKVEVDATTANRSEGDSIMLITTRLLGALYMLATIDLVFG